jgi:hypothetical protein
MSNQQNNMFSWSLSPPLPIKMALRWTVGEKGSEETAETSCGEIVHRRFKRPARSPLKQLFVQHCTGPLSSPLPPTWRIPLGEVLARPESACLIHAVHTRPEFMYLCIVCSYRFTPGYIPTPSQPGISLHPWFGVSCPPDYTPGWAGRDSSHTCLWPRLSHRKTLQITWMANLKGERWTS